jgi:glycerate kinase
MRIVIAPDKFKGSLAAQSVAHSIAEGVIRVHPRAQLILAPMADGGEGTAEVVAAATGHSRVVDVEVTGPLSPARVQGRIFLIDDGTTAVLDMASAAGYSLLDSGKLDPTRTTTHGVGELIRHAIEQGARRVLVGLGGSATSDGGMGAAQALGAEIELDNGPATAPITGGDLSRIRSVRLKPQAAAGAQIVCLHDVSNPLLGRSGTANVFASQKGASPRQVQQLEAGLRHLTTLLDATLVAEAPGMGAAGGLGFGLHMAVGAALRPGSDAVAETIGLAEKLQGAEACFTGEGRFDATSLGGKVTISVARRCNAAGVPCFVLAGTVETGLFVVHDQGVTSFQSILPGPINLEQALPLTHVLLAEAAEQVMRIFFAGRCILPEETEEG